MCFPKVLSQSTRVVLAAAFLSLLTSHGSAAVAVKLSDVRVQRDGTGLVDVTALDESDSAPETLTAFRLQIELRNLGNDPNQRVQILSDDTPQAAFDDDRYVFGDSGFIRNQEVREQGLLLAVTDGVLFPLPGTSLRSETLLTSFRVGRTSGESLTVDQRFELNVLPTTVLFDGSGDEIDPSTIRLSDGQARVTAVPEPGSIAFLGCVFVAYAGTRRKRIENRS